MNVEITPDAALLIINERNWGRNEMDYLSALVQCAREDEPLQIEAASASGPSGDPKTDGG